MTRLFRMRDNGDVVEVDTGNTRLSGLQDALTIAQAQGDGHYKYDYQNGTYQELNVVGGKIQQFEPDAVKVGEIGASYDASRMEETVSASVSQFGTIFPSDGVVGREPDGRPAVEEM